MPEKAPVSKEINPWLIAIAVMSSTFMEVQDTTVVNVSLPHIAGNLSASTDEASWTLTSYLIAMVETMRVRKSQLHINILGEHVNPANPLARQTVDGMRGLFMSQGKDAATATRQAYGAVWGMVQQQAAMLAYNDVFRFLALTFVAMLPLLFLMRKPKKGGAVMAH
jgi:MFS family permease